MLSFFSSFFLLVLSILFLVCIDECLGLECNYPIVTISVAQLPGAANFTNIQGAIDYVPDNNQWFRILVQAGNYNEQVKVDRPCIILEGDTHGGTTIKFSAIPVHNPTFYLTQKAENFVAKRMNFMNTFNYAKYRLDGYNRTTMNGKRGMSDPEIKPAVAALVMGDKASFYYCNFYGVQDTLWDQQGRHFYQNCRIEGLCDFIWGNAQSYYENCDLVSQGAGYITAQGRDTEEETTGFMFHGGTVTGIGPTYLGRAYRSHSRVIFHNTTFDHIIHPLGWDAWNYKHHEENFTYAEIDCNAGLNNMGKGMEKIINDADIPRFTTYSFINDPDKWMNNQPHN